MGIFDNAGVFTTYHARLRFRDRLMGGVPKDPKVIEAWIRTKAMITDTEELQRMVFQTLIEMGADVTPDMSYEEMVTVSEQVAAIKQSVGFKVGEQGLYLESRVVKAMLKEVTNILYAGDRWGKTKKGPKSFVAERVFVNPDKIWLGVDDPTGVHLFVGHPSGPRGPQSNLTYYEYVERPEIEFDVIVAQDAVDDDHWPEMWQLGQENGLGALRSQGFGRFDIEEWEQVDTRALRAIA